MRRVRIIPVLLIKNGGLVKSIKFKDHKYVGDPINAVRIFNEKEVDEIVILDISATDQKKAPNIQQIAELAGEAFMPLGYGGGITTIDQVKEILYQGVEKVVFNHSAFANKTLIKESVRHFGSSSVVVSIDVKRDWLGRYRVFVKNGSKNTGIDPLMYAKEMEDIGAGELFINAIERDGTFEGYDLKLMKEISENVSIPVIACGGASNLDDFIGAIKTGGVSAVAAGSMFVFQRPHRAVLISYPSQDELLNKVYRNL
jgi:imidazole glycerol-phosphate synthase subunit HisF